MKRMLIVATVGSFIDSFLREHVKILQELGYEVHFAANMDFSGEYLSEIGVIMHHVEFVRNPFCLKNLRAYWQLKKVMKNTQFEMVHCHTPMGGFIGRFLAEKMKIKRILYTAHGFHFYKGSPLKNWLLYYPIEKWLARYTNQLITMNLEDYEVANRFKLKENGTVLYIPGVGIDVEKIRSVKINKEQKRKELGIAIDSYVILNVGEISKRKNQEILIKAFSKINNEKKYLLLCGDGALKCKLKKLSKNLQIDNKVIFTGRREDIYEILQIADLFVFPTLQEGLPVAMMEAMAASLPIIYSNIRGNIDLMEDYTKGYSFNPNKEDSLCEVINEIFIKEVKTENEYIDDYNCLNKYDKNKIKNDMKNLYINYNK